MDKRKQSILKQEGRIPLQEMGLPDFPDDDTGTVTVTKSRRVSFGANFVKEFIVGSTITTELYSEYEQAFSSSDSSNPNSSHSEIHNQSSFLNDDAINLCVKSTIEDNYVPVKKKVCLEKQQNSFNNLQERYNDKNWEFNVSNNSNIFAEKSNVIARSEIVKNGTKCIKKTSQNNDSFLLSEKQFHNKHCDSDLSSLKFTDNNEKKNKHGKFSSTICFSVDSPTADMEFTEGCISLAKSIFDKKNKEMTVYIQEKKGNEQGEDIANSGDILFDSSEVEMSLTKCVNNDSEEESFVGNKSNIFDDPSSATRSDGLDESRDNIENVPLHMYPLNVLLNRHNSEEDDEIERSIFFPERSLTEMLNPDPLQTSVSSDPSLEMDNNEVCNMELSTPRKHSVDKDNNEVCNMELTTPGDPYLAEYEKSKMESTSLNERCLNEDNNEACNMELTSPPNNSVDEDNNDVYNMEITPLNHSEYKNNYREHNRELTTSRNLYLTGDYGESKMELTNRTKHSVGKDSKECSLELAPRDLCLNMDNSKAFTTELTTPCSFTLDKDKKEESKIELTTPRTFTVDKDDDEECNVKLTTPRTFTLDKDKNEESKMELTTPRTFTLDKDEDEECNMKLTTSRTFTLDKDKKEESKMELTTPRTFTLDKDKKEESKMELTTPRTFTLDKDDDEECNVKLTTPRTFTLDKDKNEESKMELTTPRTFTVDKDEDEDEECNIKLTTSRTFTLDRDKNGESKMELTSRTFTLDKDTNQEFSMALTNPPKYSVGKDNKECSLEVAPRDLNMDNNTVLPAELTPPCSFSLDNEKNEECSMELTAPHSFSLVKDENEQCNMELTNPPDLSVDKGNKECLLELTTLTFSFDKDKIDQCNMGLTTPPDPSVDKGNKECSLESTTHAPLLNVDNLEYVSEKAAHRSSMQVGDEESREELATCRDPYLDEANNEECKVESSIPKVITSNVSTSKEYGIEEENDEMYSFMRDSSFSEVMKEVVEEVNKESRRETSVIDLFRSSFTDFEEGNKSKKERSPLKMKICEESSVTINYEEKFEETTPVPEEPATISRISEGDKKIAALLTEQSQEPNCCWKIDSFAYNNDDHCWSFSSSLLGNPLRMKFKLIPPKDMSVVSFSFIREGSIELLKPTEFQSEKNKTAVDFAFGKVKNYFYPESRNLDNVHKIPLFLDSMNLFLTRINRVIDQLVRIMKEYPGSRLRKSVLSFRLHSFPLMFSLSVMIDISDPLQLSESSVSLEKHFGNFNTSHIKSVFKDCLNSEEVLIQFIRTLTQLIISEERVRGYITNRSHIRLIT